MAARAWSRRCSSYRSRVSRFARVQGLPHRPQGPDHAMDLHVRPAHAGERIAGVAVPSDAGVDLPVVLEFVGEKTVVQRAGEGLEVGGEFGPRGPACASRRCADCVEHVQQGAMLAFQSGELLLRQPRAPEALGHGGAEGAKRVQDGDHVDRFLDQRRLRPARDGRGRQRPSRRATGPCRHRRSAARCRANGGRCRWRWRAGPAGRAG